MTPRRPTTALNPRFPTALGEEPVVEAALVERSGARAILPGLLARRSFSARRERPPLGDARASG
jgi:hypothetical protein